MHNAYKYGQNPPGAYAIDFSPGEFVQPGAAEATTPPQADKLVERFRGRWPDEYEQLSELEFWDDDKTLPRCPDGCIAIVYGEFGAHKTNTILAMLFDAMFDANARVCYAAGEGAHGVGTKRIPAHCKARGITTKDLRERFPHRGGRSALSVSRGGRRLHRSAEGFPSGHRSARHVSAAIAGEDENSSKAAGYLTANGPAGRIRDAFNALVILPAHQGKDAGKKVRGHSGFMGNADVVLHVEANKKTGAIKVTVEKMRDGRDGFSIFFKVPPTGSTAVPVPEKITEEEYLTLTGSTSGGPDGAQLTFNNRRDTLVDHGAVSFDSGLPETKFAELLAGPRPRDDDADALAKWKTSAEQERTSLKNAHGKRSYKGVLCDQQLRPEATRWNGAGTS